MCGPIGRWPLNLVGLGKIPVAEIVINKYPLPRLPHQYRDIGQAVAIEIVYGAADGAGLFVEHMLAILPLGDLLEPGEMPHQIAETRHDDILQTIVVEIGIAGKCRPRKPCQNIPWRKA